MPYEVRAEILHVFAWYESMTMYWQMTCQLSIYLTEMGAFEDKCPLSGVFIDIFIHQGSNAVEFVIITSLIISRILTIDFEFTKTPHRSPSRVIYGVFLWVQSMIYVFHFCNYRAVWDILLRSRAISMLDWTITYCKNWYQLYDDFIAWKRFPYHSPM